MEDQSRVTQRPQEEVVHPESELQTQDAGEVGSVEVRSRRFHPEKWLVTELWLENREVLKALIEHSINFILLIGMLVLIHYVVSWTDLAPDRKEVIDTIDFWGIVSGLVIFGVSFIIKLLVLTFRRKNHDSE